MERRRGLRSTAARIAWAEACPEQREKHPSARDLADTTATTGTGTRRWTREKVSNEDAWSVKFDGDSWFVIKTSTIEGAGYGLFAARDFNPTNVLGRYNGVETTREKIDAGNVDDSYVLEYRVPTTSDGSTDDEKIILVDANPMACGDDFPHAGWMHMMNDARDPEKTNVFFTSRGFARTTKKVSVDDELFASYGIDYWCHEGWSLTRALWIPVNDGGWSVPKCEYANERGVPFANVYK